MANTRPTVFISYSHADTEIALGFKTALEQECEVLIDAGMRVGERWAQWIEESIASADMFVVLVSENSVRSDNVAAEVKSARLRGGALIIAPVRLAYTVELRQPLSGQLDGFQWASWGSSAPIQVAWWRNSGPAWVLYPRSWERRRRASHCRQIPSKQYSARHTSIEDLRKARSRTLVRLA